MKFIIAITLSRQVKLYLLDEPFDGIDSMSRKKNHSQHSSVETRRRDHFN